MKKYRLKEEAKEKLKPYINRKVLNYENTIVEWQLLLPEFSEQFFTCELEEVEERIELCDITVKHKGTHTWTSLKTSQIYLCEKAVNGELLDIDSFDYDDFENWYNSEIITISFIKDKLKQYLKEKK